jgi:RNA polymerase sigma-70 factor (ECF subfamily)
MLEFEHIISDFGPGLARIAASYEADRSLQEDLLQDIMLAIYRALPSLEKQESLAPFVFRIAHNRSVSHITKEVGARKRAALHEMAQETATPEQMLLVEERSSRLVAAIRRLPLPYRQVMTLLLEDLSYSEIAEALGLSLSNVGVRVNRSKAQLRAILNDD